MANAERRPVDVPVHDWHHAIIDRRVAEYRALPAGRVSSVARYRKREAAKAASWALRSHVRGQHGQSVSVHVGLDEMVDLHVQLHKVSP